MDTIALGAIAVGVVAAIGVVLVAMNGSDSKPAATEAAKVEPAPAPAPPRPRPRRRQQAIPKDGSAAPPQNGHSPVPPQHITYVPVPPHLNGYATDTPDPLVAGFMQVVSTELQSLRQQQDRIDQRLKMINGIAELMHDMQGASANGTSAASRG